MGRARGRLNRFAVAMIAAAVTVSACGPDRPAHPPPPAPHGVLLIVIDCLRADHLSSAGYERRTTPALDRFSRRSVVFEQAISPSSWTRPSLPSFLTGLYPSEHGLLSLGVAQGGGAALSEDVPTVAEVLSEQGYRTALFGDQAQLSPRFGLNRGFNVYRNRLGGAYAINREFLSWLGWNERPFFAYLHYLDLHWPYCPPKWARGRFDPGESEIDWCDGWRRLREEITSGQRTLNDADRESLRGRYDELLLSTDHALGKLFRSLHSLERFDDTLILVTSDHGEEFLEHGAILHGQSLYEELIHVPLIIKAPESWGAEPRRVSSLVEGRAVAGTLAEAVGALDGLVPGVPSLVPEILGRETHPLEFAISESVSRVAVRTPTAKLVVNKETGEEELYDLVADPGELENRIAVDARTADRLRGYLRRWAGGLGAATPAAGSLDEDTAQGLRDLGYLD